MFRNGLPEPTSRDKFERGRAAGGEEHDDNGDGEEDGYRIEPQGAHDRGWQIWQPRAGGWLNG